MNSRQASSLQASTATPSHGSRVHVDWASGGLQISITVAADDADLTGKAVTALASIIEKEARGQTDG
jgi:hypothetical protein